MPLDFDIITGLNTSNSELLKQDTDLRLAEILAVKPNFDSGGIIMPNVPTKIAGNPLKNNMANPALKTKSAFDSWLSDTKRTDKDFNSGAGIENKVDAKGTERYLDESFGYNPNRDNEDFYAKQQSAIAEIPKAIFAKLPSLTLAKLGTGLGYIAGLVDPTNWGEGYIANAADNGLARAFDGLEDNIKNDWLTTFQESADQGKGFFSRAFTDLNFWTEDVTDGAAFLASAFVPGLGIAKIGFGIRAAELLSATGIAAENGVLGNLGLAKLAGYMRNAQKIATGIDKTLITALSTASEAMWEAKGVKDSIMDNLKGTTNPETGQTYTDPEIRAKAGQAAQGTFLANAAILSLSNLWETNLLYKAMGKAETTAGRRVAQEALGESFAEVVPKTKLGKLLNSTAMGYAASGLKGVGVEGFYEENAQLAVQRIYDGTGKSDNFFSQILTQTGDALMGKDTEAAMNIGIGGLIGLAGGLVGHAFTNYKEGEKTKATLDYLNGTQANWMKFGNIYERDEAGNTILDDRGNPKLDNAKLRATISNWNKMTDLKIKMDNTSDPDLHKIIQKEAFSNFVQAHINAGIADQLDSKLNGLLNMSDDKLVQFGFDPNSNNDRAADIADLRNYAKELIELNDTINDDILNKPISGEDPKVTASLYQARKSYLFTLGARQIALTQQSNKLTEDLDNIRARLGSLSDISNKYVDDLNYIKERILSQRRLIEQIDNYTLDGEELDKDKERQELTDLTKQFNDLKNSNKELYDSLTIRTDDNKREIYQYKDTNLNKNILAGSVLRKTTLKAQLDNAAATVNREFYSAANNIDGHQYFKSKVEDRVDQMIQTTPANDTPIDPSQNNIAPGNKVTISMQGKDVELEEGKLYIGQLSKTTLALAKGAKATVFNNDKIKIISINPDGSVTLTINDDAPVTFTQDELSTVVPILKYDSLTNLQKFYLANRNNVYQYRIPTKYNKETKTWETSIVSGRLSYDKKNNILNLAYKVGDKIKYIEFNPKFVKGFVDVRTLPTEQQAAIAEQQAKMDALRATQYRLFENLINNTDTEIAEQKQRANDNQQELITTQERLDNLLNDLKRYQQEFEESDKSRVEDKRTKAGRINRIIKKLEAEISTVNNQLERLKQEGIDISTRQEALSFMMDEYLSAYDNLLDTNEPVTRAELNYLEHREGELASQDTGAQHTIDQIQKMLNSSIEEAEAVEVQINNLEGYLKDLRDMLDSFKVRFYVASLFDKSKDVNAARTAIRDILSNPDTPSDELRTYTNVLKKINRNPKYFEDVKFIIDEIKDTTDILNRAKRGNGFMKTRIQQLSDNLDIKNEIADIRQRKDYLKDIFSGLAKEFEKEKAAAYVREQEKNGKTTIVARTVEDAKNAEENNRLFSEFITEPPLPGDINSEDRAMFWDTDKPVMTNNHNPLYKSADSHFPNDVINPQPYTQRFFKFSSTVGLDGSYYIMPITEDNDGQFGENIRFNEQGYNDDIKFIVVRKVGDKFVAIDTQGNTLSNPNNNNIVYSSFYGHPDLLSNDPNRQLKWVRDNFAIKENMSDAQLLTKVNEYLSFRNDVKRLTKQKGNQYIQITSKSNGYQNRVPKDTVTGLPQELSVEGRLTEKNPNWKDVDLIVSTLGGIAGQTNVKLKPGRLAIRKNGNIYQVYNRQLTDAEQDRIKRLLIKLVYSFGKKQEYENLQAAGAIMTPEEIDSYTKDINTANTITQYLSSVIYWDRPQSGTLRTRNQFQIDKGYLRRGSGTEEVSTPFTVEGIEKNIDNLLDGVYHQVANRLINSNAPYNILDIDPNTNDLTFKTVDSYKEYLMSGSEPVIYTNVVEDTPDPSVPQMINSYITFGDLTDRAPVTEKVSKDINISPSLSLTNGEYIIDYKSNKTGTHINVEFTKNADKLTRTKVTVISGTVTQDKAETFSDGLLDVITDINEPDSFKLSDDKTGTGYERIQLWRTTGDYQLRRVELVEKKYEAPVEQVTQRQAEITPPAPTQPIVPDTAPQTTSRDAADVLIANMSNLGFRDRVQKMLDIGVISDIYTYGQRPVFVFPIGNGKFLPMYRSSKGTSGKKAGQWFPMFGFGKSKAGDTDLAWLIKGTVDQMNNNYNSKEVADLSKVANALFTWDHSLDLNPGNVVNPFYKPTFRGDEQAFNKRIFGKGDLGVVNDGKSSFEWINSVLESYKGQETEGTTPLVVESSQQESLVPSVTDLLNQLNNLQDEDTDTSDEDDYDNYRLINDEDTDYVKENKEAAQKWFNDNLPQFTLSFTPYLIKGKAWGQFKGGAIHIYENAPIGTGFHEAFEAVWASTIDDNAKQGLLDEFRKRSDYKALLDKTAQTWKGLSEDQLIKETLAEEFREYVLSDGKVAPVSGQGKRNSFFRRLWNFIKSLFSKSEDELLTINELFRKINTGAYSQSPLLNYEKAVAHFKNISGVSQEVTAQAIEGITANFFIKLFAKQENTDSLFSKQANFSLLNDILTEVRSQIGNSWNLDALTRAAIEAQLFKSVPTSDDETKKMLNNLTPEDVVKLQAKLKEFEAANKYNYRDKLTILSQFKSSVLPIFYDYLRQYGFVVHQKTITELDTETTNNEEVKDTPGYNDPLGIRDSITIDTRNTANTTVKLLVASLTDSEYSKAGIVRYKKNGLGLPKLVDYDKTINVLFNELQGIIPVFKNGVKQDPLEMMFDKLDNKYNKGGIYNPDFVWIHELKRKLKYMDKTGNRVSLDTLKEEDVRLRVAFTKSFSKSKNNPLKLILSENNNIYVVDPVSSANTYRIREAWNNNAKASTQKSNDFLKVENNLIVFNTTSPRFSALLKSPGLTDKVEMLRGLGIVFSISDAELVQRYQKTFGDAMLRISEFISRGDLKTYDDLFSKQNVNGPINDLLNIELDNNAENLSLQYRNPSGENEYSIVNSSNVTNILNSLKNVDNITDFILTNPQFGSVSPDGKTILIKNYLKGSQLFKLGGIIFDNNGKKKKDLTYQLVSGIAQATEADGEVTAKLKRADKVLQELFHMGNGTYYTIINSDKSSEFGLNMGEFVSMFDFTVNSDIYNNKVASIYSDHLRDEVNSLIDLANGIGDDIQYYSDNQKIDGKWVLSHFRDIITSETNKNKLQQAIKAKNADAFVNDSSVQQEIANYLKEFISKQQQTLINLGIINQLPDGTYSSKALSTEQMSRITNKTLNPKSFNKTAFDNLTRYLFINHQIAVREQHKLIYGHPALYKDLPKRSNGATSTKEAIVDSTEVNQWLDKNYPRLDGKVRASETVSTFKNISYKDNTVLSFYYKDIAEGMYASMINDVSKDIAEKRIGATFNNDGTLRSLTLDKKGEPTGDMKAYIMLNEADAQAYILPDFYRDLLFLSAKLSMGQQRQINYEIAYERQARSKKNKSDRSYKDYTPQERKDGLPEKDTETLALGNPGYVLPVLKPQYFGYTVNPNITQTTFLKHSVKPLFYRNIEGTNMETKYSQAQQNQIDIIGYESGHKVGNVYNNQHQFDPYYNEDGANSNILPPISSMYTKFYGIQVEMAAKLKDEVIRGTQMTKIIMSNLFENGEPKRPEYRNIINDYVDTLVSIIRLGKQDLLKELGLQHLPDGSYITTNLKKLVSTLRDEAVKRDLPSNIIEAFEASLQDGVTGLVYKFDSFSNRDKIDNILNAIVDSRVISQHMHGKPAVQAAVTGTEKLGSNRRIFYLKDGIYTETSDFNSLSDVEKKSARIGSSDLKFYHLKGNKIQSMEVLLPHWFKELYGKDTRIDINDLDPRLLQLIGFRIPTQGMNSIDSIIVKGFLNPEEGDTVVVPSEIAGKSGSDFDIDKLNIYIPNYKMVNGKPTYIEYTGDNTDIKGLQNRLIEIMTRLLTLPDNYRQLVVPNSVDTLKGIESLILSLRGKSKNKGIPFTSLSEWNYMNETRERFLVGKQLVGIGALHITNNAITQIANTYLSGIMNEESINIRFPHNVNSDGKLYLSAIKDKAGQWISELLSEALSGFVDAAKDPFVFELNMNPATAGTYFYLMRLGVPVRSVALFHTQPVIMDYISNQQNNESMLNKANGEELSKAEITALTQSDYISKAFPGLIKDSRGNNSDLRTLQYLSSTDKGDYGPFGYEYPDVQAYRTAIKKIEDVVSSLNQGEYKESQLETNIRAASEGNLTQEQAKQQLVILSDFLKHQQEANALSTFINAVSYDTASTKNIIENVIQQFNYNKVIDQNFIANPSETLSTTFLGEMKRQKDEVPKMFQNYFVSLHPNAQAIFQPMYRLVNDTNLSMTDDSKKEFLNRYQNFFLNYLLHTVRVRNPITNREEALNNYYKLFFGMDSFAHQLKKAQLQFPNSKILQELFPIVSTDRTNTDNVKLFTSKLSTYESNSIIESAVDLMEKAQTDPTLTEFVNNLAVFSIIQSGVQVSPISYTKVLPNELYANLVGNIFDKFTDTATDIDPAIVYKQFFQNNYGNGILVPPVKPSTKGTFIKDGILTVKGFYRIASYDYLVRRSEKLNPVNNQPYTQAEKLEIIKNKQWDDLYERTLYEKFLSDDKNAYFRPINKLGNRIFATEVYRTDTSSMTKDQIVLSGINGYIDETAYSDVAEKTEREEVKDITDTDTKPPTDEELNNTKKDLGC